MYISRKSEALIKYKWDMMSLREKMDTLLNIIMGYAKTERGSKKNEKNCRETTL